MEGRINSARRSVNDHQLFAAVARDQAADDALGQVRAIPTSIASDDDAHAYSIDEPTIDKESLSRLSYPTPDQAVLYQAGGEAFRRLRLARLPYATLRRGLPPRPESCSRRSIR
jgi:hypothetical protein